MEERQRWEEEMIGTGLPLWLAVFGSDVSMNFSPHRQKLVTTRLQICSSVDESLNFTVPADTVAV